MTLLPLPFDDPTWLHGRTAFTTIRTHDGVPLLWEAHLARLANTCAFLGLPDPTPEAEAVPAILQGRPQGRLRLTATERALYWSETDLPHLPAQVLGGVTVRVTGMQVHPQLAAHKTGNYLPYVLAAREAEATGAFEGLLTDYAGHVVDGSRTSLLLAYDDELVVPSGGLPGVTRAALLSAWGRTAVTRPVATADLARADRAWLCGSGIGVLPVRSVSWPDGERDLHPERPPVDHPALVPPVETV